VDICIFVKKLILWSKRLLQTLLSYATCFIYRAAAFFNKINLYPHSSYYLRNTVKLIFRSSFIIEEYLYPINLRDVKQKAPLNRRFAYLGSARSSAQSSTYRGSAQSSAQSSIYGGSAQSSIYKGSA